MAEKLFNNLAPNPPAQSPMWQVGDSLGVKIEKVFTRYTQGVILWGWQWFAEIAVQIFDASMKILQPGMARMFGAVFDQYINDPAMPKEIKDMLTRVKNERGESAVVGMGISAVMMVAGVFAGGLEPFGRRLGHIADVLVRSFVPDPNMISAMERFDLISGQVAQKAYWNNGVGEEYITAIKELSRNIPAEGELMAARWRGVISDAEYAQLLKRRGYDDKAVSMFDELSKMIPPISDLIRFQVREAFDDAVSAKFGYDADYPSALDPYIKKLGYDPDWGKRYWRAHWTLPSPTQAFEMLHRGLITQDDLASLLQTADYPEFWREKLMKISFNPYTRVDVRRLLQAGIIGRDEAKQNYRDQGYDEEKAEKLTQFAERGASESERDLSMSQIAGMYVDGLLDGGAMTAALVKMGYDQQEADAILKQADFDVARNARVDAINYVKEQYVAGKINANQARADLTTAGLSQKSVDRYLLNWDRAIESEIKGLSLGDARRLFGKDIITEAEFREALKVLKYTDKAIELFVKEALQAKSNTTNEV